MANVQVESSWLLTVRRGTTECIMFIFLCPCRLFTWQISQKGQKLKGSDMYVYGVWSL